MAQRTVSFKGTDTLHLEGREVKVGDHLPDFVVTGGDMKDLTQTAFAGKKLVICTLPSLDTPVCSAEMKRFNTEVGGIGSDVAVLAVSMDLPFAQKRWCGAEGVSNVTTASDYKHRAFGNAFGVHLKEWGLLARAVFVADKNGKVVYAEYVPDISQEPAYDSALTAVKNAG